MTASIKLQAPSHMTLEGQLNKETVASLRREFSGLIDKAGGAIDIDLVNVTRSTSVGLSLLLCYLRKAKSADKTISFVNMPEPLYEMARVSGIDGVLPIG